MRKLLTLLVCVAALTLASVAAATNGTPNGGGHDPVTVCHKPGTPAEQELTFDDDGLWAHLNHGDSLGPCVPPVDPPVCPEGTTEYSTNPLVCLKETTNTVIQTNTVYVDRPVVEYRYVEKLVPGPVAVVTKFIKVKVRGKTQIKKVKVIKIKRVVKIKKVKVFGICKLPSGRTAVMGAG